MLLEMVLVLAGPSRPGMARAGCVRPAAEAAAVLHAWDERRAAAWSAADPVALRALYAPDAAAGRADVRMLDAWSGRGVRVEGLRMQLLRVVVRRASPARLELVVTDRLARATVVGPGWRHPLPHDAPTTRTVTLLRLAGEWRVADARPAA